MLLDKIGRFFAELLEEAFGEIGGTGESNHIAHLADEIVALKEQLCGALETHDLDHLVGSDVGERLDLGKESAATDV